MVDTNVLPICPEGQITDLFTCLINTFILTYWQSQKANGLILVKMSGSNSKINTYMVGSDRYSVDDSARDAGGENKVSDSECHVLFSNEDSNAVLNVLNAGCMFAAWKDSAVHRNNADQTALLDYVEQKPRQWVTWSFVCLGVSIKVTCPSTDKCILKCPVSMHAVSVRPLGSVPQCDPLWQLQQRLMRWLSW